MGFFETTLAALYVAGITGLIAVAYRDFGLYVRIAPAAAVTSLAAAVGLTAWDVAIHKARRVVEIAAPESAEAVKGSLDALAVPFWCLALAAITAAAVVLSAVVAERHKPKHADGEP